MIRMMESLNAGIADAGKLSHAAAEGQLEVRADQNQYRSNYREIIQGMNKTLEGFTAPMNDIAAPCTRWRTRISRRPSPRSTPGRMVPCGTT